MIIILVIILVLTPMSTSTNFLMKAQMWKTIALSLVAGSTSYFYLGLSGVVAHSNHSSKPRVVATTSILCDVTKQIAQDTIDLTCLVDAGSDPHDFKPRPSDRMAITRANLVLYSGYSFEPEIIKLINATNGNFTKVAVNEMAVPLPLQFEEDGEKVSDPHVFHTAQNGARIVEVIGASLNLLAPSKSSMYKANTKKLSAELLQIDSWIKAQIATIPPNQRKLVTTHDAFGYYSKAYGISVAGALQGVSTEEQATPKRVSELVRVIKQEGVPTVFAESTINPKLITAVAKEAKVKVSDRELFADGLGEVGSEADTYQKFFIANTQTIVEGLGGQFTPFKSKSLLKSVLLSH
jgi:manganese/iron transport system substrate-binding protein